MPETPRPFADLAPNAVARIAQVLAARPCGLFSDLDGTLSAIAPTPETAVLLPGVRSLLEEARDMFDVVAVVSGRAAADVQQMVGVAGIIYIGNHGFEQLDQDGVAHVFPAALPYRQAITNVLDTLERTLAPRLPGLQIEPKGVTASIHVRNAADPPAAEEEVYRAAI